MTISEPTATRAVPVGKPVAAASTTPQPRVNGMAVASMVLGILGLFFFGVILGPLAIIFGCIANGKIKESPEEFTGECQAKAGIICGIIALVLWVIVLIVYVG
jgi:Domain of unknown function (DUF4190)